MDVIEYLRGRPHFLISIIITLLILALAVFRIGRPAPARTYRQGCIAGFAVGIWLATCVVGAIAAYLTLTGRLVL